MARRNLAMSKTTEVTNKGKTEKGTKKAKSAKTMQQQEDVRQKINAGCLWGGD